LDLDRIYEMMDTRIFIDGRIYDPKEIIKKDLFIEELEEESELENAHYL
jgi:hypothetical protein